jgi:hypothetical protein
MIRLAWIGLYCPFDKQYPGNVSPDYNAAWFRATAQHAHPADRFAREILAILERNPRARGG